MRIVIRRPAQPTSAIERWRGRLAAEQAEQSEIAPLTIGQLLTPLRLRWPLVLGLALLGLAIAVVAARLQKPVYEATALIEIQAVNDNFLNLREMAVASSENILEPYLQTQLKILVSPELLQRVAAKLELERLREFGGAGTESLLKKLEQHVNVRISGQTRIIEITAESTDPALARALSNTMATEFIAYTLERRLKYNRETTRWLGEQLRDLKSALERSEQQLQNYARSEGLLYTADQSVAEARLRQLQESLSKAQADRIGEQSRMERALASPPESLPEVLDDPALKEYQIKLIDLKRQLAERSSTLEPAHYRIRELRAQISELETAVERGRANVLKRIRNQYDSAVKREQMEADAYAAQATAVAQEANKAVRYKSLKQEADSNRQLYEAMFQKVKEAGIASAVKATNVELLSAASLPEWPTKPRVPLYATAGMMGGLASGVTLCFLIGGRRRSSPGPVVKCDRDFAAIPHQYESQRALLGALPEARPDKGVLCPELVTLTGEDSPAAEALRAVVNTALLRSPYTSRPHVLAITSGGNGEGKTTLACNFALVLARMNQRVLLIDAHVRRPRLYDIFGIPNGPGLPELIAQLRAGEGGDLARRFAADLSELGIPGLYVLPAGEAADAGLLRAPGLPAVFQYLRKHFDFILIDAPPLSEIEGLTLARAAEGVIMVAAPAAGPEKIDAALRRLVEDGANVLGIVLNNRGAQGDSHLSRGLIASTTSIERYTN